MQAGKNILLCGPDQEIGNDKLRLGRHTRVYVCITLQSNELILSSPFIVGGRSAKPFPVVIFCESTLQADDIYNPLRNFTVRHHTIEDIDTLLAAAEQSDDITTVSRHLDRERRFYWVVVNGHRVGIYLFRSGAKQSLDNAREERWRKCYIHDSFLSAFKCALGNGTGVSAIDEVAYLPNEDNQNDARADSLRRIRFQPYHVRGNIRRVRQRGYDDRAARCLVTWGLANRTLSITSLIQESRSKAEFIDNLPRFMEVDKASLLWDLYFRGEDRDASFFEFVARCLVTWGLSERTLSVTALIQESRSKADFIDNLPRFMDVDKASLLWDLSSS